MSTKIFILLVFLTASGLSACVKNQDTSTTTNTMVASPDDYDPNYQNINDTNYQATLRNQTARAQSLSASHSGGGGRR